MPRGLSAKFTTKISLNPPPPLSEGFPEINKPRKVPTAGLEPAHPKITDFESVASTNSATSAFFCAWMNESKTSKPLLAIGCFLVADPFSGWHYIRWSCGGNLKCDLANFLFFPRVFSSAIHQKRVFAALG